MKISIYSSHNWICLIPLTEAFSMLNRDRHQDFQNKTIQTISNSIFYFSSFSHTLFSSQKNFLVNQSWYHVLPLFLLYSLLRFQALFNIKLPHCRLNFSFYWLTLFWLREKVFAWGYSIMQFCLFWLKYSFRIRSRAIDMHWHIGNMRRSLD